MHIDVLKTVAELDRIEEQWARVYRADPEAHYFLSWTWMRKWLESLNGPWVVLAAKPDADATDYTAFFPLRITSALPLDGTFRTSLRMAGSYFAVYTGFVCDPQSEALAIRAFAEHIKGMNWAELHLDDIYASQRRLDILWRNLDKPELAIARKKRPRHLTDSGEDIDHDVYVRVPLPADWETFLAGNLGTETRRSARRCLRKVEDGGEWRVTFADPTTIDRDLQTFARLWNVQWEAKDRAYARFIISNALVMVRHCVEDGSVLMPVLWHADTPIGVNISFIDRDRRTLTSFLGARDLGVNKPSPGFLLHLVSMRWGIANGFATYDLGTGNFSYKYSFGATEHHVQRFRVRTKDGFNRNAEFDGLSLPAAFRELVALRNAKEFKRAEKGCDKLLTYASDFAAAHLLRDELAAYREVTRALLAKAEDHGRHGHWTEAEDVCQQVLARDRSSLEAHVLLACCLLKQGRTAEAESNMRRAIELEPRSARAHYNLAAVLVSMRRYREALESCERALSLKPDFAEAHNSRGRLQMEMGEIEEAKASFSRALALQPGLARAAANLERATQALDLGGGDRGP